MTYMNKLTVEIKGGGCPLSEVEIHWHSRLGHILTFSFIGR